jgi:hypothetical protein
VNNYITITLIKIKPAIGMIVLAFTSLILITGSPFQIVNNLVENNGHLYIKNIGQDVYGQGDDGGGGDDGGDDSSDSDDSGDSDDGGDEADDGGEDESDESEELETSSEEATEEEEEPEDYNPNNVDSDGDGLYDDEEPTEEEIKASEGEEDDTETNNEDRYRDITTAGEDVEGFERFVEEKKGKNYNFETDYHWETPEEQRKLEEEFNEMKLKRAGEDLKPTEIIPIK